MHKPCISQEHGTGAFSCFVSQKKILTVQLAFIHKSLPENGMLQTKRRPTGRIVMVCPQKDKFFLEWKKENQMARKKTVEASTAAEVKETVEAKGAQTVAEAVKDNEAVKAEEAPKKDEEAPVEKRSRTRKAAEPKAEKKTPGRKKKVVAVEEAPVAKKAAAAKKEESAKKEAADTGKAPQKRGPRKAKEVEASVCLQYSDKEYSTEKLVAIAKDIWQYDLGQDPKGLKSVELYVKPEENAVYYVMNKETTGSFTI